MSRLVARASQKSLAVFQVIDELITAASPGLMASASPRYYGFVIGGSLDAALVADVIASGWDQNAYTVALSPAAIAFEDVAGSWIKELLGLPETASVGFATGGQGANTAGLAAGRWQVLHQRGWDVGVDGLHGAPQVRVVASAERHATIDRSVRLLGLGENAIVEVEPVFGKRAHEADVAGPVVRGWRRLAVRGTRRSDAVLRAGWQRRSGAAVRSRLVLRSHGVRAAVRSFRADAHCDRPRPTRLRPKWPAGGWLRCP